MKVTTDACLFGAWVAKEVESEILKIKSVLDIGAGTGLLSLMIAQKNSSADLLAVEIDKNAEIQAYENVNMSPWKEQVTIVNGDVKDYTFTFKFNFIVSNPPFYEREIRSSTDNKNIAHHSDELKLDELLEIVKNNLSFDGYFFLLLPYKRNEEIKKLFRGHQLHVSRMIFVRQSVKHDYFRIFIKGSLKGDEKETEFNELSIWDDKQQYTNEFVTLLKDYYLHL